MTSPSQLVPLAQTIQGAGVTAAQREVLWASFNSVLPNLQSDDRSFSALLVEPPAGMDFIVAAVRQHSAGCKSDAAAPQGNNAIQGSKTDSTPKVEAYWQSAEAQRMMADGKKLRFGDGGTSPHRSRSLDARVAAAINRLPQRAGGLEFQFRKIRSRLLQRKMHRLYRAGRAHPGRAAARQDAGSLH